MQVQKFLREYGLKTLCDTFTIRAVRHPELPLVILNYTQGVSPKDHPIVRECRSLVLELDTWQVVARAFPRFFNYGEFPEEDALFQFEDSIAHEKVDGSLMLLFYYGGRWLVTTRGSFATGKVGASDYTWEELFWKTLGGPLPDEFGFYAGMTLVFELVSTWNQVVIRYEKPSLYLLGIFSKSGQLQSAQLLDHTVAALGCNSPLRFAFASFEEATEFVKNCDFEGVVLQDRTGHLVKVKSPDYVAKHLLHSNGDILTTQGLLSVYLRGEIDEVLVTWPDAERPYFDLIEQLHGKVGRMMAVWERSKHLESQAQFAKYVKDNTELASVLFAARKGGEEPLLVLSRFESKLQQLLNSV